MFTQDDLRAIGTLMDDKLGKQKNEILQEVDRKLENQKNEILQEVDRKLENQKNEIIKAVADTIHDSLLPLLDNHEERIERLEKNSGLTPLPIRGQ